MQNYIQDGSCKVFELENPRRDDYKSRVRYRMAKLGITQNDIAQKLGVSYPYVSDIMTTKRDTPRIAYLKDRIVEILDEAENGSEPFEE